MASGWGPADKRAYVIADNKLALLSSWDVPLLKGEIELLIAEEFEIETTGFSTAEIDLMFEEPGEVDSDDLQPEDVVEELVSRPGDLWRLGPHRLLCGDALVADSYVRVLGGEQAQMGITDPPYNVRWIESVLLALLQHVRVDQSARLFDGTVVAVGRRLHGLNTGHQLLRSGVIVDGLVHQGVVTEPLANLRIEDFLLDMRMHRQGLADALRRGTLGSGRLCASEQF